MFPARSAEENHFRVSDVTTLRTRKKRIGIEKERWEIDR